MDIVQNLRLQLVVYYSETSQSWEWETEEFFSGTPGFETQEQAQQNFERFLAEEIVPYLSDEDETDSEG